MWIVIYFAQMIGWFIAQIQSIKELHLSLSIVGRAKTDSINAPVATTEDDDDEDDATINKWSKIRVKALKFNENTYYRYIVLVIIFIGSIALVNWMNVFNCNGIQAA